MTVSQLIPDKKAISSAATHPPELAILEVSLPPRPPAIPPKPPNDRGIAQFSVPSSPIPIPPKPPDGHAPDKPSANPRPMALATKTKNKTSLQTLIGKQEDETMLGKFPSHYEAIQHFIPPPQEAPPNIYGKCTNKTT